MKAPNPIEDALKRFFNLCITEYSHKPAIAPIGWSLSAENKNKINILKLLYVSSFRNKNIEPIIISKSIFVRSNRKFIGGLSKNIVMIKLSFLKRVINFK